MLINVSIINIRGCATPSEEQAFSYIPLNPRNPELRVTGVSESLFQPSSGEGSGQPGWVTSSSPCKLHTERSRTQESNPGPSCCEAAAQTTAPPCRILIDLKKKKNLISIILSLVKQFSIKSVTDCDILDLDLDSRSILLHSTLQPDDFILELKWTNCIICCQAARKSFAFHVSWSELTTEALSKM